MGHDTALRSWAAAAIIGIAAALTTGAPAAAQTTFLSMGTSSAGSTWFPLGGAMAAVLNRHVPDVRVNIEATGGNVDNVRLLGNDQIELGLITSDQAWLAAQGESPYEREITNFKGLLAGGMILWQAYTHANQGIEAIADLDGARISLGSPGSIGNSVGELLLAEHGLVMGDDWTPDYLSHGEGPGALKDGRVNAVVIIGPVPTGPLIDLTSTDGDDVVFLMPEEEVLAKLLDDHPYWSPASVSGGIYPGHDEDVPNSFGIATILVAHENVPDDVAYEIVKALLEHPDELREGHALGAEWVPETATRGIEGVLPLHPGAERYLREQGLL